MLEHLSDDVGVLCELRSMLVEGGALMLTLPAHPLLWSYYDEAAHHQRRYRMDELELKLNQAGYWVEYITQYMVTISPLMWLRRRLGPLLNRHRNNKLRRTKALYDSELALVPVVNEVLAFLLTQEARMVARRERLSIGTSLLAVARNGTPTV